MARRDEEIFKKLKKQTPLAKRRDLQPLSSDSFRHLESNKPKRVTPAPSAKQTDKRGAALASRYNSARQQDGLNAFGENAPSGSAYERSTQPKEPKKGAKSRAVQTVRHDGLEFTEPTEKKQSTRADSGYRESMSRVDQHDVDYLQEHASNGEMAFRHELKYYINYHDYVLLKNTIKALLSIDRNANEDGHYFIRSVYFDDVYETALKEKIAGTDERCKYRIRFYNYSDNVIRFEKKIKRGQYISKISIGLTRDECDSLIAGDYYALADRPEPLAREIYLQMKNNVLRPRVIVDYWREAFVSPLENVRITFDKDLKGGLWLADIYNPKSPTMPMLDEGTMVLEVKFNRYMPEYIKAILSNVNTAQRSAISKYVLCRKFD